MAPDSGEPDAAALRERVAQLEQTVADQQQTIDSLSSPTASRRGVLSAAAGVAGLGALGIYSSYPASAQASGQVGTVSDPVDVEAWDLTVQNQLAADLDAGGNSLTNVGAVETEQTEIKNETLIVAKGDGSPALNPNADTWVSPSFQIEKDERNEFNNDQFTPDKGGFYQLSFSPVFNLNNDDDRLKSRLQDLDAGSPVGRVASSIGNGAVSQTGAELVGIYELTGGTTYQPQVKDVNNDSFVINSDDARFTMRSVFR